MMTALTFIVGLLLAFLAGRLSGAYKERARQQSIADLMAGAEDVQSDPRWRDE
jgi:type II secretory pathway pseudopilin PulG